MRHSSVGGIRFVNAVRVKVSQCRPVVLTKSEVAEFLQGLQETRKGEER